MTAAGWREAVVAYIRAETLPLDKFGHMPRLYALAARLGQGTEYDDDVLFAAAWMHDLGVFLGHRPEGPVELAKWDHVPYTIEKSRELLAGWGFPAEKLEAFAEVIRTHQPKDNPAIYEAVLLRDADILEQLGAIGALRAFVKVGRDTRFPTFSSVLQVIQRAEKTLPPLLRTDRAQLLALPRVILLRSIISAINEEAGELLF